MLLGPPKFLNCEGVQAGMQSYIPLSLTLNKPQAFEIKEPCLIFYNPKNPLKLTDHSPSTMESGPPSAGVLKEYKKSGSDEKWDKII